MWYYTFKYSLKFISKLLVTLIWERLSKGRGSMLKKKKCHAHAVILQPQLLLFFFPFLTIPLLGWAVGRELCSILSCCATLFFSQMQTQKQLLNVSDVSRLKTFPKYRPSVSCVPYGSPAYLLGTFKKKSLKMWKHVSRESRLSASCWSLPAVNDSRCIAAIAVYMLSYESSELDQNIRALRNAVIRPSSEVEMFHCAFLWSLYLYTHVQLLHHKNT